MTRAFGAQPHHSNRVFDLDAVLGERESGTARLEEAVSVYRAALQERTRERVPLDWAMTQTNLGSALRRLGERESGTVRLEEAVSVYRAALQERTRERVPLQWAMTQTNLGTALRTLGKRTNDGRALCEALRSHCQAWAVFAEGAPYYAKETKDEIVHDIQGLREVWAAAVAQTCLAEHATVLQQMGISRETN